MFLFFSKAAHPSPIRCLTAAVPSFVQDNLCPRYTNSETCLIGFPYMVILRGGEFLSVVIHSFLETLTKRPTSAEYFTTQLRNCCPIAMDTKHLWPQDFHRASSSETQIAQKSEEFDSVLEERRTVTSDGENLAVVRFCQSSLHFLHNVRSNELRPAQWPLAKC